MDHNSRDVASYRFDSLLTVRSSIGGLPRLLTALEPTMRRPSVEAVDPHFLRVHRIERIIWDLDGTLTSHGASNIHPRVRDKVACLFESAQAKHIVLSNAPPDRLRTLSAELPGVPFVKGYTSGRHVTFRTFLPGKESWTNDPSPQLRALRKPDLRLVEFATKQVGATGRDRIVLVGDQYFTDITPANLAGLLSVKVPTLDPRSFPLPARGLQLVERLLCVFLSGKTCSGS